MMKSSDLVSSLLGGVTSHAFSSERCLPVQPITERSLKRLLGESVNTGVSLSGEQARVLVQMLERGDPFKNGKLDTRDVEVLGIDYDDDQNRGGFENDDQDNSNKLNDRKQDDLLMRPQPIFGPETAVVAPNATPGYDAPIPKSVLSAMEILMPKSDYQDYSPAGPTASPALSPSSLPTSTSSDADAELDDMAEEGSAAIHESVRARFNHRQIEQRSKKALSEDRPSSSSPGGLALGALNKARRESKKFKVLKRAADSDPALTEKAKSLVSKLGGASDDIEGPSAY